MAKARKKKSKKAKAKKKSKRKTTTRKAKTRSAGAKRKAAGRTTKKKTKTKTKSKTKAKTKARAKTKAKGKSAKTTKTKSTTAKSKVAKPNIRELIGQMAPDFSLKDKDGNPISLSSVSTKYTLLFFYPKDNTPGCTIEAQNFSNDLDKFQELDTTLIGISGGDENTKTKFVNDKNLRVQLLSDPDFTVCRKYKAYGKKSMMGRTYDGIYRVSFLLDQDKKIVHVFETVKPPQHSEEVQNIIRSL